MGSLSLTFTEYLTAIGLLTKSTKGLTSAIILETIAKKASAAASKINAAAEGLWNGMMKLITGGVSGLKSFAVILGGLGKAILPLTLALGKLLAVIGVLSAAFVVIHDLFKGLANVLSGKAFYDGTISQKIADWLYSQTNEAIEIVKSKDYLDKLKSDFDNIHKVLADFEKQIAEVNF
jgi:hypothetical protein